MTPNITTNPKPPASLSPKLTPTPSAVSAVNSFAAKPKIPKIAKKVAKTLADESAKYVKTLFFGHSGTGKTKVVTGYLLHGLKVFVISTDIGGEGLNTVRMDLKHLNRPELLKNCTFVELDNYDEVEAFVEDPTSVYPPFYEEDFDVLFWDGMSGFQQIQLDRKVLQMAPAATRADNVDDARNAGLWAVQTDWGQIKRGTMTMLDQFLTIHNKVNGRKIHKTVTCLESGKVQEDKLTQVIQKSPLISGAAAAMVGPAFDVVAHTKVKRIEEGGKKTEQYVYEMVGTEKLLVKSRGIKLDATEPADFYALWTKITSQLGLPAGKAAITV